MTRPKHWWELRIEVLEAEVDQLRTQVLTDRMEADQAAEATADEVDQLRAQLEAAQTFRELLERFRIYQAEPGVPLEAPVAPRILWVDPAHRAAFEELGLEVGP